MSTKKVASHAETASDSTAALREKYGCGPIDLTGTPHALYERHLLFDHVADPAAAGARERYEALARSVRDVLSQRWARTEQTYERANAKRVYYLSMEFLIGRSLTNNITNLLLSPFVSAAVEQKSLGWLGLLEEEPDAALGNGGLGRLAACFLDSMATMQLPAMGYGLRYEYGMFRQSIVDGWQHEQPDNWLRRPDPWEVVRPGEKVEIRLNHSIKVREGTRRANADWSALPEKVAVQLNDTHPAIAVPELLRILLDEAHLGWDQAWDLTQRTLAYTNHTLLPEALEQWPLAWFETLLPRHLEIIFEINRRLLDAVRRRFPGDEGRVARTSLIEEAPTKHVRMANLAIVGSHSTNGVAAIHSALLRSTTVKDLDEMFPERFRNQTNGVTPRRWMLLANPPLAGLNSPALGDAWTSHPCHPARP